MIDHLCWTLRQQKATPKPPPYIIFQGEITLHIVLYFRPSADPEFDGGYGTDLPIYDDDGSYPEGEGEPEGEWWIYSMNQNQMMDMKLKFKTFITIICFNFFSFHAT